MREKRHDLSLPLRLSDLSQAITEKEGEREKLSAKLASSSQIIDMMMGLSPQLKAIGDKFPRKSLKESATQTLWRGPFWWPWWPIREE